VKLRCTAALPPEAVLIEDDWPTRRTTRSRPHRRDVVRVADPADAILEARPRVAAKSRFVGGGVQIR
jgi:hypothetical protein